MMPQVRDRRLFTYLSAAFVLVLLPFAYAYSDGSNGPNHVKAVLNGFQEVPSIVTTGSGEFEARIEDTVITYELSYQGLEGGATVASHIHLGGRHENGGVIAFLCGGGDKPPCPQGAGTVSGMIDPADIIGPAAQGIEPQRFDEAVLAIRSGNTYVNVHSVPRWPGGEIRGQISDTGDPRLE